MIHVMLRQNYLPFGLFMNPFTGCLSFYLYQKGNGPCGINFQGPMDCFPVFWGLTMLVYIFPLWPWPTPYLSLGIEETHQDISNDIPITFFQNSSPETARKVRYPRGQILSVQLVFQSSVSLALSPGKSTKDDMDPSDYIENVRFYIAGCDMKYKWLLPFMAKTRRGPCDAWQLLMILWDMDWAYTHRITLEQVASIKKVLDHHESYKEGTQCIRFIQCMTYRDSIAPEGKASREWYYERAIEDAEKSNVKLDSMETGLLRDIL